VSDQQIKHIILLFLIILFFSGSLIILFFLPGKAFYQISETHYFRNRPQTVVYQLPPENPYQKIDNATIIPGGGNPFKPKDEKIAFRLANSQQFQVQYRATVYDQPLYSEENIFPYNYLGPSQAIETHHPLIIYTARQITSSTKSYEVLRSLQDFLQNDFKLLPTEEGSGSALQTLEKKEGNLEDLNLLFTGLCRTRGIPTKTVSGIDLPSFLPFTQNRSSYPDYWWTEIFNPEQGWVRINLLTGERSFHPMTKPFFKIGKTEGVSPNITVEASLIWYNKATHILILLAGLAFIYHGLFWLIRYRRPSSSEEEFFDSE